ncbi:MAG: bifunctional diaminohydroxyphosphoribosylaminopyrimidine deaminase/5-amino-6-(5-phosphoribosylamino)uracil reductase RibD [Ectothiorhodospiraceae bacterium]|nr:bifunctional diaminohydroxyphosphoribosylaminopyrimidine deaminase/5-amino-6-(5-phosphoribosylamino)uracil reductase RibD [Ectothiorhodospiraceae bacterium]MCH8505683.1 bifunctional diaminohydroxyphosphoribosylaminopyrimidine deaminase/5-amino-6-(5-phosphoribosylamino)uracil reductase RibD [Ectothiorhodospiraceae bacterium]
MARALQLAERGLWTTRPNPRVGCVLVSQGRVVGEGWHLRAGEPHAEPHALRQAGERARGATAYVTLEPCSHHGRTPPCAEALVQAGVSRVVVAMEDPNPQVAGRGLQRLQAAGIQTASGLMQEQARRLNAGFCRRMTSGMPYVRVKLAASLDGRTAMASGESRWITGAESRADVHRLRARSCAVITGAGTVLADDPALTVRDVAGTEQVPPPLRVVLDSGLRISPEAQMLQGGGPVVIYTASRDPARAEPLIRRGARVESIVREGRMPLRRVLELLGSSQINEVLVEAGPTLAGAFIAEGLVDELWLYQAMHLMGDAARPLLRLPGLDRMEQRRALRLLDVRAIGDDMRLILRPTTEAG